MEIKIDEFINTVEKVLKKLKQNSAKNTIKIDNDFYWFISKEDLYDPYTNPEKLTLGQLSDDLENMRSILNNKVEPVSYDLVKLSSLMRLIGEETVW